MATIVNTDLLPREMQQHTYSIMYEVEERHWWFVGRRRIIEKFVVAACRKIGKLKPRILDVGCGTGANLQMLGKYGEAEGVDISPEALEFCRARGLAKVKQGAAESLPFENASFDLVTALDVVEHLDDDVAGLKEMRRVLRPRGRALLFVPAFMFLWGVQDDVSHHRRRYTASGIATRIRESGLTVERITYANLTFFLPILIGRSLMRLARFTPASENNINIGILNGLLGRIFAAEGWWLQRLSFPFGVSIVCVARRDD
ncbi:MAG TPA: class I SAM-dependent methyltransferase [Pyrinomonadaceae bacterium]|jgi:SAM-dependent methyltransferase|nr:class I SAM-dependent methyltransferase [Pyrinomonadaceae bacterium]